MKTGLLLLAVAIVLGALVGTLVVRDPGYVLISYGDYALESSLWFFAAALVAGYVVVKLVVSLVRGTALSGSVLASWVSVRRGKSARQQTVQGLLMLGEGRWAQARKLLTSAATRVDLPLVNYLGAARAADRLGDFDGRDALLRQAQQSTPGSRLSVSLTQAELQGSQNQWEQCLATLLRLREESPRHPLVLKLMVQCYRALGDDQAALELLPEARKTEAFDESDYRTLLLDTWSSRIEHGREPPDELLSAVPKELRREPALVRAYASAERGRGVAARALPVIESALDHGWDADLISLYGSVRAENPKAQLQTAERWLKQHSQDSRLLLALGRLSMANESWPKAREYLEASLRLERSPEVYAELGRLCSMVGETERGNEYLMRSALPDDEARSSGD